MAHAIGRIVHYKLTAGDAEAVNRRRKGAQENMPQHQANANGVQVHAGNDASAGDVYPMMIVRVWGDTDESSVNGQVFLDGNDSLWVTSVIQGDGERQFVYPLGK